MLRRLLVGVPRPIVPIRRCLSRSQILLSGHNKWSKIKERKGANDLKKSAIYGKAARDIVVAVRNGGSADPEINSTLATALRKAKDAGVPKENVEKALARAVGGKGSDTQTHVIYEGMACGSVGLMIECLTNNATRTNHKIREILTEHNARFAPVGFLFEKRGFVRISLADADDFDDKFSTLWTAAEDAGAEDFEERKDSDAGVVVMEIMCPPDCLNKVTSAVTRPDCILEVLSSELIYHGRSDADIDCDGELSTKINGLREALEDHDDCLRVWTTIDGIQIHAS